MADELQKQYLKEHPERKGESDKEFALTNYIEWLENKLSSSQDGWVDVKQYPLTFLEWLIGKDEKQVDRMFAKWYLETQKSPQTTKPDIK